jgi:hypothetical protein
MRKSFAFIVILMFSFLSQAQESCYTKLEQAFLKRGAYEVGDAVHTNVILSFFNSDGTSSCVTGRARVENGRITHIDLYYDDGTYGEFEKPFFNEKKNEPVVIGGTGISEMIYTSDNEKFKVIFIEKLKPKQKALKEYVPTDL